MPVASEFRGRVLALVPSGDYDLAEVERALENACSDNRFRPGMTLLFDARRSLSPPSSEDVEWYLEFVRSLPSRGLSSRSAFLLGIQLHAVWELAEADMRRQAGKASARVFLDEAQAMSWLEAAT